MESKTMEMVEVRVHVPVERETQFYRWFADWRDGTQESARTADATPTPAALEPAIAWWKSLTAKESALWGMWIEAAPAMVRADVIVGALDLKGPREIPGVLSWSGRKGQRVGFPADWSFRNDPITGDPIYGIEDTDYASLIGQARDAVEQPNRRPRVTA